MSIWHHLDNRLTLPNPALPLPQSGAYSIKCYSQANTLSLDTDRGEIITGDGGVTSKGWVVRSHCCTRLPTWMPCGCRSSTAYHWHKLFICPLVRLSPPPPPPLITVSLFQNNNFRPSWMLGGDVIFALRQSRRSARASRLYIEVTQMRGQRWDGMAEVVFPRIHGAWLLFLLYEIPSFGGDVILSLVHTSISGMRPTSVCDVYISPGTH